MGNVKDEEAATKDEEKTYKDREKEERMGAISSRRRRAKRGSKDPPETLPKEDPRQSEGSMSSLNHSGKFDVSAQASSSLGTNLSPGDWGPCFL